jgi:hypothetical protein
MIISRDEAEDDVEEEEDPLIESEHDDDSKGYERGAVVSSKVGEQSEETPILRRVEVEEVE